MASIKIFKKDPNAKLDYSINWLSWLKGDTIAESTWTVPAGITKEEESNTDTIGTVWVSGGTKGTNYALVNQITTAAGRVDERSITIRVEEQ